MLCIQERFVYFFIYWFIKFTAGLFLLELMAPYTFVLSPQSIWVTRGRYTGLPYMHRKSLCPDIEVETVSHVFLKCQLYTQWQINLVLLIVRKLGSFYNCEATILLLCDRFSDTSKKFAKKYFFINCYDIESFWCPLYVLIVSGLSHTLHMCVCVCVFSVFDVFLMIGLKAATK